MVKNATLLIDADSLLFQSTVCSKEQDEEGFVRDPNEAVSKFDERLHLIINTIWENHQYNVDKFALFVGGSNNYRKLLFPTYKDSRKKKQKPVLLDFLKTYIVKNYGAFVSDGCEADDSIYATWLKLKDTQTVIIATVDKDLKQIPCLFFDYYHTRMTLSQITEKEATYTKYKMLLIGDSGDDVNPIKGLGEKHAQKLLDSATSNFSALRMVYTQYKLKHRQKAREMFLRNLLMVSLNPKVTTCELFNEI